MSCIDAGQALLSEFRVVFPPESSIVNHPVNVNLYCSASACMVADAPSTAATAAATPLALNVFI
jgi:hypothetical protein